MSGLLAGDNEPVGTEERGYAVMGAVISQRTQRAMELSAERRGKLSAKLLAHLTNVSQRTARRVLQRYREDQRLSENRPQVANSRRFISQSSGSKRETVLFLYDIHLPYENADHIEMALDYSASRHKLSHIVLGGDCVDFQKASRFVSPADAMELVDEVAYAVDWLRKLRERFSSQKITYIMGNHEDRLQRFIRTRSPELDGLKGLNVKAQLELDEFGIQYVDNLKLKQETGQFYSIGKLTVLHGHELGICPSINPARQYFLKALDNMICGHVHKVNDHYDNTLRSETKGAFVCGCLCDMHPGYKPQNGWIAGFGMAHFDADGMFSVKLKKIINGRVL